MPVPESDRDLTLAEEMKSIEALSSHKVKDAFDRAKTLKSATKHLPALERLVWEISSHLEDLNTAVLQAAQSLSTVRKLAGLKDPVGDEESAARGGRS